jgi:hypothetical protein
VANPYPACSLQEIREGNPWRPAAGAMTSGNSRDRRIDCAEAEGLGHRQSRCHGARSPLDRKLCAPTFRLGLPSYGAGRIVNQATIACAAKDHLRGMRFGTRKPRSIRSATSPEATAKLAVCSGLVNPRLFHWSLAPLRSATSTWHHRLYTAPVLSSQVCADHASAILT